MRRHLAPARRRWSASHWVVSWGFPAGLFAGLVVLFWVLLVILRWFLHDLLLFGFFVVSWMFLGGLLVSWSRGVLLVVSWWSPGRGEHHESSEKRLRLIPLSEGLGFYGVAVLGGVGNFSRHGFGRRNELLLLLLMLAAGFDVGSDSDCGSFHGHLYISLSRIQEAREQIMGSLPRAFTIYFFRAPPPLGQYYFYFPSLLSRQHENNNNASVGGFPSLPCPIPKHNAYHFGGGRHKNK